MIRFITVLFFVCNMTFFSWAHGRDLEVVTWPYHIDKRLSVAQNTIQPFYLMVYDRQAVITGVSNVEISMPAGWQIWLGSNPPPKLSEEQESVKFSVEIKAHVKSNTADYRAAKSAGNLLLVVRPLNNAVSNAVMTLKWSQNGQTLATSEVKLELLPLLCKVQYDNNSKPMIGLWINDPKFDSATMDELYRSFHLIGVNYVIISPAMFMRNAKILKELGMKVFINQWWNYHAYVPGKVPPEAVSTLKDGKIDINRWSPTYMANGGKVFLDRIRAIVNELKKYDGVYGLMLDYEPGIKGIDADYGQTSKITFEEHLGQAVADWPKDVLPGGNLEEKWIDFRCSQSVAYVNWFKKIMQEQTPNLKLAVSTSGASGRKDDINRRLAVTDIDEIGVACDSIHPQLYSWTSKSPGIEMGKFKEKLDLGNTTIKRSTRPVYTTVGSASTGAIHEADPRYLRMQILNWWLQGENMAGVDVWQYFYGVDGRYMGMLNELAGLFTDAGEKPNSEKNFSINEVLQNPADVNLQAFCRKSRDKKKAWIGFFNFSNNPVSVKTAGNDKWQAVVADEATKVEPWSVLLVKYLAK